MLVVAIVDFITKFIEDLVILITKFDKSFIELLKDSKAFDSYFCF